MHAEVYTDGIDEITVGGSIVRVDLVSLSPTERDANNAPKKVFCQRLIFSIEAFANSVEVMQNALQGLIDAEIIKRNRPITTYRIHQRESPGGDRGSECSTVPKCLNKFPLKPRISSASPRQRRLKRPRILVPRTGRRSIAWPESRPITASICRPTGCAMPTLWIAHRSRQTCCSAWRRRLGCAHGRHNSTGRH